MIYNIYIYIYNISLVDGNKWDTWKASASVGSTYNIYSYLSKFE